MLEEVPLPLRESCDLKEQGLFDQITYEKNDEVLKIRELDDKLSRLDQMKKELYEQMTKPIVKKEVT